MTTESKKPRKEMAVTATKKRNPKFRVIPNLSLRGKDIMIRLKNRSLVLDGNGQYTLDKEIDEARRMSKADVMRKHIENGNHINEIKNKLQHQHGK